MSDRSWLTRLKLPLVGAPMFTISDPALVLAQCRAGIIGSFPALNARQPGELEQWFDRIQDGLDSDANAAPYAVNIVVNTTNQRLDHHIDLAVKYRAPIVITCLGRPTPVIEAVSTYGGMVWHDVATVKHAKQAAAAGVHGLVLVTAGAGGHTGHLNPFAFVQAVRDFYDGVVILAGGMSRGHHIHAAQIMGADAVYMGSRFIASTESRASDAYKKMIVDSTLDDVICSAHFTGVPANFLKDSIERAGFNMDDLKDPITSALIPIDQRSERSGQRAWWDIWGAGHSASGITKIRSTSDIVTDLEREYREARLTSRQT